MSLSFLKDLFANAINICDINEDYVLFFEEPKNPEHGDYATNIAMQLTKKLKMPPRNIAENIINNLPNHQYIEFVQIAGPGFINIKLTNAYFQDSLIESMIKGNNYGKNTSGNDKKVNVEYVSANPTGLLHLGHGRNACIGDTIANLFEWNGWDVVREYYFNNAGNQMNNLGKSIFARYKQLNGEPDFPFPEDGYHGDYIKEIAGQISNEMGQSLEQKDDALAICRDYGEKWCFEMIIKTMKMLNVHHDIYYNESSLYDSGKVDDVINRLTAKGLAYEKDGAKWIALSKMGLENDRVIVKSSGEPTYRLPDIAYHIDKFERGNDFLIDIFGADHIATIPDVIAALKALGYDSEKVKVIIHQFVTLMEDGKQVKMSKRSGKSYTLDELIEEVGADVVRFFFIMRGVSTHLEFDLSLAREQSDKNPVFYLQYAHARICSVIDTARERGIELGDSLDAGLFTEKQELNLIKQLLKFPQIIRTCCDKCEPQILAEYLRELAAYFHVFYHDCRVIGVQPELQNARLHLMNFTRIVLGNGLAVLGISAPERM